MMKDLICALGVVAFFAIMCYPANKLESDESTKAQADSIINNGSTTKVDNTELMRARCHGSSRPVWDADLP